MTTPAIGRLPRRTIFNGISGCVLDLCADFGLIGTTTVRQWCDISGARNDVFQHLPSAQPTITLADINGRAALTFDGTDDTMLALPIPVATNYTVFVVTNGSVGYPFSNSGNTTGHAYYFFSGSRLIVHAGVGNMTGSAVNASTYDISGMRWNGTAGLLQVNGTAQTLSPTTMAYTAVTTADARLSISGRWNATNQSNGALYGGRIARIVMYNRALTDAEMLTVTTALRTYYGL